MWPLTLIGRLVDHLAGIKRPRLDSGLMVHLFAERNSSTSSSSSQQESQPLRETSHRVWARSEGVTTPGISVIVPTYNEVENVSDLITRVDGVLQKIPVPSEILIVDDRSPDGTAVKARGMRTVSELRVIVRQGKRDLSSAVLEGFEQARHEVLVVCDADLSHPVEKVPELVRPILEKRADMAIGSRYAAGGRVEGWSWHRKLFSHAAKLLARPLVKVRDPMSGFFAIRKSLLEETPLWPVGYKIGLELIVRLDLKNVVEVPILFRDRRQGASKLGGAVVVASLKHLGRLIAFQLGLPGNPVSKRILGGILGLSAVLHLLTALSFGLIPEEAYHWNFAKHPALSYFDHPPMVGWMIWLGTFGFGDNRLGVRVPAVLVSLVTALLIYRIAHMISLDGRRERNGLIAVLLYSALPYFWGLGFISMPDTFLALFWTAALYALLKALEEGRPYWWYAAGAYVGLAMLSKYTAVLLGVGTFLFLIFSRAKRFWLRRREPYLAGLLALVVFSPVLLWNLEHGWVSFYFQTMRRFEEFKSVSVDRFLEFLATQALAFWPPAFLLMLYAVGRRFRALVVGEHADSLLVWSFLPTFLVFAFVGLRGEVHIAWPAPAYLGLVPLIATMIGAPKRQSLRGQFWRMGGMALLFLPLALYPISGLYLAIFGVPVGESAKTLIVWEELARRVALEEKALMPGPHFIFADGKYQIASELAFYLKAPERVFSRNVIGRNAVSFNYWSDLGSLVGKDAIFVAEDTEAYRSGVLTRHFDHVSPPQVIEIRKAHTLLATFFLIHCYGYKGPVSVSN